MITELSIYWITRLDGIREFVSGCATFISVFTAMATLSTIIVSIYALCVRNDAIVCHVAKDGMIDELYASIRNVRIYLWRMTVRWLFPTLVLVSLLEVLVPTTKEYCAIKVVPAIINSEKTQGLTDELYNLGIEWIKELKPSKTTGGCK